MAPSDASQLDYTVVAMEGDYDTYLESRLPMFVRNAPHWCSKGLTSVEIDPLGEEIDGKSAVADAMYAHPSRNAHLLVFRQSIVEAILRSPEELARKWAARMSTPEFTHSADGNNRLEDDWSIDDALRVLGPLGNLAKMATPGQSLYLLLEW